MSQAPPHWTGLWPLVHKSVCEREAVWTVEGWRFSVWLGSLEADGVNGSSCGFSERGGGVLFGGLFGCTQLPPWNPWSVSGYTIEHSRPDQPSLYSLTPSGNSPGLKLGGWLYHQLLCCVDTVLCSLCQPFGLSFHLYYNFVWLCVCIWVQCVLFSIIFFWEL